MIKKSITQVKILICGGSGQLGIDCSQVLSKKHDVLSMSSRQLDITNLFSIERTVDSLKPDIILNCAAFTGVDDCEIQKELAYNVNACGPENLTVIAEKHSAKIIHISTDYLFDGKKKVPDSYLEDDKTCPVSYYGITKLAGENAVQAKTDNYIIIRTAWLYGFYGHNFLKTMLRLALNNSPKKIKIVNDQFGSPTWSYSVAVQIEKLIDTDSKGLYHVTTEGYCTWYELTDVFMKKMNIPFSFIPCSTAEYPTPAARPLNSILENHHLKNDGINLMQDWKIDIEQFVLRFKDRLINESMEL